jgi:hypothetical protein
VLSNAAWIFHTPEDGVMSVNMSTCVKSGFIAECQPIHNVWLAIRHFGYNLAAFHANTFLHRCQSVDDLGVVRSHPEVLYQDSPHCFFCLIPVFKLHRVVDFDGLCNMACCTTAMFKSLVPCSGPSRISSVVVCY